MKWNIYDKHKSSLITLTVSFEEKLKQFMDNNNF